MQPRLAAGRFAAKSPSHFSPRSVHRPELPHIGTLRSRKRSLCGRERRNIEQLTGYEIRLAEPIMIRAVAVLCVAVRSAPDSLAPDLGQVNDAKSWRVIDADASVEGRAVRLTPHGDPAVGSHIGLALLQNGTFSEGTLEIDLRGAGRQQASFLGLAFGVADATTFEAVYFRPFRFADDDAEARSHAVQYVAWPEYTWEKLRKDKPRGYEAAIEPVPDPAGWFHARIEVTKQKVSISVDGSTQPCLVVDRLGHREGAVALWVDSMPGVFRNLRIAPR